MPFRQISSPRLEAARGTKEALVAGLSLVGRAWNGPIDGLPDDRGDGHPASAGLGAQTQHLLLGQ